MLWEDYKTEFNEGNFRPSYSSNFKLNKRKIIRLYKQYRRLYTLKRNVLYIIQKIFLGLEYVIFPLNRKYIYKYGLYLQENRFLELCNSESEILKIHQD